MVEEELTERQPFRILVIGDVMLDKYVEVETERRAQEADIPIWDEVRIEHRLGGAANVAANLVSIGRDEVDVSIIGIFDSTVADLFGKLGIDYVYSNSGKQAMVKERFAQGGRILFRHDNFTRFPETSACSLFPLLDVCIKDRWNGRRPFDAVIVSDYDKGSVVSGMEELLRGIPLRVVDSKRENLKMFEGFDVLKLNQKEYADQVSSRQYACIESMFGDVVVTKGAEGAELRCYASAVKVQGRWGIETVESSDSRYIVHTEHFPIDSAVPVDVTGCGDTHTAALTFSLLKARDIRMAVRFANECARKKVQMFGTGFPREYFI